MPIITIIGVDCYMKKVALYIRVSSEKQAKHGDSLREQEDTLNEYVKSQHDMIVHSTYIDDGISGQKLERDEFQRLMNDVQNNHIDVILFTKLDRWFRSLKHYLNNQDVLEKHNVHWLAVSQPYYDTTTAYGRTFINQVMSFAELEAQMTSERLTAVFANKIKMGEVASGSVPLGYEIIDKHLVPSDQAPIVLDLFEYQDLHANLSKTSKYLFDTYNISRSVTGLRRMFQNKIYIGINRENTNFCEPIVPSELFNSVNDQLTEQKTHRHDAKYSYIFTGLLICGECHRKLNSGMRGSKQKRKDGTIVHYKKTAEYSCRHAYSNPRCPNTKRLKERLLEKHLLENFDSIINSQLAILTEGKPIESHNDIPFLIQKVNKKINRLKELYVNDLIDLDEYKKDRMNLVAELQELENKKQPEKTEAIKNLTALLEADLFAHYHKLSNIEKSQFWKKIVRRIEFDNDRNITIKFN